jgi:hypothetical protein
VILQKCEKGLTFKSLFTPKAVIKSKNPKGVTNLGVCFLPGLDK